MSEFSTKCCRSLSYGKDKRACQAANQTLYLPLKISLESYGKVEKYAEAQIRLAFGARVLGLSFRFV